ALILLRNRGVLDPTELLSLFFGLFHCQARKKRETKKSEYFQQLADNQIIV
ncbi:unnamed protein product, partial [Ectocarpus sp. 8 AP-2014]